MIPPRGRHRATRDAHHCPGWWAPARPTGAGVVFPASLLVVAVVGGLVLLLVTAAGAV